MKKPAIISMCLVCLFTAGICFAGAAQSNPVVKLETNFGDIVLELYYDEAPITVTNFLGYVNSGFYEGLIFHRVIEDFMIQAGGFDPNLNEKTAGDPIVNESYNGLSNLRGTIAMARTSDPNSATSQFFINQDPNDNNDLDRDNYSDGYGYCVFGEVISDMNVVDSIAAVPTGDAYSEYFDDWMQDVPNVPPGPIVINSATQLFGMDGDIDGDIDSDNEVDMNDLAIIAGQWLEGQWQPEFNRGEFTDVYEAGSDLSGDIFVWSNGPWNDDPNIKAYNLETDTEFVIDTGGKPMTQPAISGNKVVWRDYRNYGSTGTDIYGADISDINDVNVFAISTAVKGQMSPAIDGNTVVWDDYRRQMHDIYGADISDINDINVFAVCTEGYCQEPAISGDIVVWRDKRSGNYDIYGYKLSTDTEFAICTDSSDQYSPAISGNLVIWIDGRNSGTDLYGADISDINDVNEFFVVGGNIDAYDLDGDHVVRSEQRNGQWDIYGLDISDPNDHTEFIVCRAVGIQAEPLLSGDVAAWRDWRNIEGDLYWRQLCDEHYAGDLNGDCTVNFEDYAIMTSEWLESEF